MDVQRGERREGGRQPSGQPECIETTVAFNPTASLLPAHGGAWQRAQAPRRVSTGTTTRKRRDRNRAARGSEGGTRQRGPGSLSSPS